jgi:hypothetical protein
MKTVKIRLEYKCFPIWIYDEQGSLLDNDMPEEIKQNRDLEEALEILQEEFDSLYIDNGIEFGYKGFQDYQTKQQFTKIIQSIDEQVNKELNDNDNIINLVDLNNM